MRPSAIELLRDGRVLVRYHVVFALGSSRRELTVPKPPASHARSCAAQAAPAGPMPPAPAEARRAHEADVRVRLSGMPDFPDHDARRGACRRSGPSPRDPRRPRSAFRATRRRAGRRSDVGPDRPRVRRRVTPRPHPAAQGRRLPPRARKSSKRRLRRSPTVRRRAFLASGVSVGWGIGGRRRVSHHHAAGWG